MQKSKDITKYQLDWQVARVKLKELKTAEEKVNKVIAFLHSRPTAQMWERVVNYLEGLEMGYRGRNENAVNFIRKHIQNLMQSTSRYNWDNNDEKLMRTYTSDELRAAYKDNFNRYKKFCQNGYFHQELYDFLLSDFFEDFADEAKIEELKKEAFSKPNTHKFFF